MTGNELLRKLRQLARRRGVSFQFDAAGGKGGHGVIKLGIAARRFGRLATKRSQEVLFERCCRS